MKSFLLAVLVFYPFIGAFLCYAAGRVSEGQVSGTSRKFSGFQTRLFCREYVADLVAVTEFLFILALVLSSAERGVDCTLPAVCGMGLHFTLDGFRMLYGLIAAFMWMMTTAFSGEYMLHHEEKDRYYLFLLLTLGAVMGVFLSADLFTTFLFFEIMSFTSYVWVAQEEDRPSLRAAETYLTVAVIGGMVMLMGLFLLFHELGTLQIRELLPAAREYLRVSAAEGAHRRMVLYAAGGCMFFGFGAKAGAFPLHIWLPKAHPVAPAPASALLSGILTKAGIYGILILTADLFYHDGAWGKFVLAIGVPTMLGGAVLAVFSVNLKRTLACSSMSQIGFILVGVGMQGMLGEENALAVHGTLLHMMNHSMIKLVLFMAAGVVFMNLHELDLNEIRGFGRKKPLLKLIFLAGALAIGGIPGFGGYVSKTLLHESIVEYGGGWMMRAVESIFLFSGGLTVAYMTKLYVAVFVEENESKERQRRYDRMKHYMNAESTAALTGSASLLLIWGLFPYGLMDRAAKLGQGFFQLEDFGSAVSYFSLKNLSGACISIAIGVMVYLFVIRKYLMRENKAGARIYADLWPGWLDLEELIYRPLILEVLPFIYKSIRKICDGLAELIFRPMVIQIIPAIAVIFGRIMDSSVDLAVVGLRKTVYRDSPLPHEPLEGNAATSAAGRIMNFFRDFANRTWRRTKPIQKDYVHVFAVWRTQFKENHMIIGRSLSFGLMLFCIGLCLTLIYIIWF